MTELTTSPRATVAIATYNRADLLRQTLQDITRQHLPSDDFEVIVVDNNSNDHTPAVVADFPTVRYAKETQQGLSHARNRAIAEARGGIIVFADDDILAPPNWLGALLEPFDQDGEERIGAVGGEVIPFFPTGLPEWVSEWHSPLALRETTGEVETNRFPMGANLAIRRSVFSKVGQFNENLGRQGTRLMGGEETEFLRRLRQAGYEIWFAPAASVRHVMPASRTTFSYARRHSFDSACSRVIERAAQPGATAYLLSRFPLNVGKAIAFTVLAGLSALTFRGGATKKALVRAWRSCGYLYQIPRSVLKK